VNSSGGELEQLALYTRDAGSGAPEVSERARPRGWSVVADPARKAFRGYLFADSKGQVVAQLQLDPDGVFVRSASSLSGEALAWLGALSAAMTIAAAKLEAFTTPPPLGR
jgi:hypothetical protein